MPQAGADGWYEFFFDTNVKSNPVLMEDGSVDYQNAKWFELVKKGQTVAVYHEAQEGTPGYTIMGESLATKKGKEKPIRQEVVSRYWKIRRHILRWKMERLS